MLRLASVLLASCLLACCASLPTDVKTLPTVTVTKRVPVIPPANLLIYCVSIPSDGTIGRELQRLDNLAKCGHDRLEALNVWAAQNKPAADADLAPAVPELAQPSVSK